VVDRIGEWEMAWLTPVEAASRRWASLSKHREFAGRVQSALNHALQGIDAGLESTDIHEGTRVPTSGAAGTSEETL